MKHFTNVHALDAWGVADAHGFHLHDTVHGALRAIAEYGGTEYAICKIDGDEIAVFIGIPAARRAEVAARRPEQVAGVVFVDVLDPKAAVLQIDVADATSDALERSAFAGVYIAFTSGCLETDPEQYTVRVSNGAVVDIHRRVDSETGQWHGTASLR